ncbi:MAG: DUF3618 domain-containing protein [Actinobacteria bacterium]|nr:DUF3618 domain-containing protein [Actinomycetota bacterium]
MSEIPERIEREMFEIRSRMAPDVKDLRQHVDPKVVGKQLGTRIKERIRGALTRAGKGLLDSARRQAGAIREAGRKRNPSAFTDAVKSDPRPMILLAVVLAATLMAARKISNGREG